MPARAPFDSLCVSLLSGPRRDGQLASSWCAQRVLSDDLSLRRGRPDRAQSWPRRAVGHVSSAGAQRGAATPWQCRLSRSCIIGQSCVGRQAGCGPPGAVTTPRGSAASGGAVRRWPCVCVVVYSVPSRWYFESGSGSGVIITPGYQGGEQYRVGAFREEAKVLAKWAAPCWGLGD